MVHLGVTVFAEPFPQEVGEGRVTMRNFFYGRDSPAEVSLPGFSATENSNKNNFVPLFFLTIG
jgi:hypothetical protein